MKPSLVVLTAVVILLAAVGASHLQAAPAASQASTPFLPTPPVGAPQQLVVYAHIKSITAKGGSFEAKVDPAEYLSGETANRAAIADRSSSPATQSRTTTTSVTRATSCSCTRFLRTRTSR